MKTVYYGPDFEAVSLKIFHWLIISKKDRAGISYLPNFPYILFITKLITALYYLLHPCAIYDLYLLEINIRHITYKLNNYRTFYMYSLYIYSVGRLIIK